MRDMLAATTHVEPRRGKEKRYKKENKERIM